MAFSGRSDPPPECIGVPVKLLQNCEGHAITVEDLNGKFYSGKLEVADTHMNLSLTNVIVLDKAGAQQQKLDNIYIRSNRFRFIILPPALQKTPLFEVFRSSVDDDRGSYSGSVRGRGRLSRSISPRTRLPAGNKYRRDASSSIDRQHRSRRS